MPTGRHGVTLMQYSETFARLIKSYNIIRNRREQVIILIYFTQNCTLTSSKINNKAIKCNLRTNEATTVELEGPVSRYVTLDVIRKVKTDISGDSVPILKDRSENIFFYGHVYACV